MNLQETTDCLHALDQAHRRGVSAADIVKAVAELNKDHPMVPRAPCFSCNKCGYVGAASDHLRPNTLKECGYLAGSVGWRDEAQVQEKQEKLRA
ncbi:hypothetical protein D3C71_77270 [compost metagenome]